MAMPVKGWSAIFAMLLVLVACVDQSPRMENDQQIRMERFDSCMKALPAGPQTTMYNDWDEVVRACESSAYYQSMVCVANCPKLPARKMTNPLE